MLRVDGERTDSAYRGRPGSHCDQTSRYLTPEAVLKERGPEGLTPAIECSSPEPAPGTLVTVYAPELATGSHLTTQGPGSALLRVPAR